MNKSTFRVLSLSVLCLDIIFALFVVLSIILTLAGVWIIGLLHLIVFISAIALNVAYVVFLTIRLFLDRRRRK